MHVSTRIDFDSGNTVLVTQREAKLFRAAADSLTLVEAVKLAKEVFGLDLKDSKELAENFKSL